MISPSLNDLVVDHNPGVLLLVEKEENIFPICKRK